VLALLFGHVDQAFYLREIVRQTAAAHGAVQREVKNLSAAGILLRTTRGRNVYYQADPQCPIFSELRGMIMKTAGVAEPLRAALTPLAKRISVAFIYGSFARLEPRGSSDLDLLIIGEVEFGDVVSSLSPTQEKLGREINPTVYPEAEFRKKLAERHHFLTSVLTEPKIFIIGDESELERLAAKRLAKPAHNQPRRDSLRKKRKIGGYERAGLVSDQEAKEMLDLARALQKRVTASLRREHSELAAAKRH